MVFSQGPQEEQHELGTLTKAVGQLTNTARVTPSLRQLKVLWNHFCVMSSSLLASIRDKEGPRLWTNVNLRLVYIFKNVKNLWF